MLYEKLKSLYFDRKYREYIDLYNDGVKKGITFSYVETSKYASSLIKERFYDRGYEVLKELEKLAMTERNYLELAFNYYCCNKLEDALRVLTYVKKTTPQKIYLLAKIYMFKGDFEEAKQYINYILYYYGESRWAFKSEDLMKKIKNHYEKDAFIEISYDDFVDKGNKLEEGYVIYLNDEEKLECNYVFENDSKNCRRPFVILKREGDTLYLAPVTFNYSRYRYALFQQDYPNSKGERYIGNAFCITKIDNVYSVSDKLIENELDRLIKYLLSGMCFNLGILDDGKKKFYDTFMGEGKVGEVIVVANNLIIRKVSYYYIVSVSDDKYYGYLVNYPDFSIKEDRLVEISKKEIIYNRIPLDKDRNGVLSRVRKRN